MYFYGRVHLYVRASRVKWNDGSGKILRGTIRGCAELLSDVTGIKREENVKERERKKEIPLRGQRSLFNSFRRIGDGRILINIIYDVNFAAGYRFR